MPEKVLRVFPCVLAVCDEVHALCNHGACYRTCDMQLILRSINTARSAFVAITFRNEYFDAFDVYETVIVQAGVLIKVTGAAFLRRGQYSLGCSIDYRVWPRSKWRLCSGRSAFSRSSSN